jgi:hypothetical protein
MMRVYTYSEARQLLARLLDEARDDGEVRIRRQDGTEYSLRPVQLAGSPLDVPSIRTDVTRDEILAALRESRERMPGG